MVQSELSLIPYKLIKIDFSDTLDDIIEEAKTNGTYEEGILDIGNANDKIEVRSKDKFWIMEDTSLDLIKVHDYRGVEWDEVKDMRVKLNGHFYIDKNNKMPFMFYPKADKVSIYSLYLDQLILSLSVFGRINQSLKTPSIWTPGAISCAWKRILVQTRKKFQSYGEHATKRRNTIVSMNTKRYVLLSVRL